MREKKTLLDIIDKLLSQSRIIEYHGRRAVMKKYGYEPGLVKWLAITALNMPLRIYPFTLDPRQRMERETVFFTRRPGGVRVPRVLEENWEELYIIREYVEGEKIHGLSPPETYAALAETLARIHGSGYAMGDTKFTNFLDSDGIIVIDAEQAVETMETVHYSWDILVILTTLTASALRGNPPWNPRRLVERFESFVEAYAAANGDEPLRVLVENKKLRAVAAVLLPPPYSGFIYNVIRDRVS